MKWSMLRSWPLITMIIFIIGSCAKQAIPTGGPKDIKPPEIVKSIPPNSTINFKDKKIVVTFNEYFVLEKIDEKFMISPPMHVKPKISVIGKNLIIEFQEPLKDSTTYTLYFQDAIKDLNEGNPLNNFQFVFSTGKEIDSLSVTGNALNSYNLEAEKNILVLMYRNLADSAPGKLMPDYLTQTDINGGFRIDNIKAGKYRLYVLHDNNNNNKYDLADEAFAFMDSIAEVIPSRNYLPVPKIADTIKTKEKNVAAIPVIDGEYKLFLIPGVKKAHYLTSSGRKLPYLLTYTLSLPPDTSKFEFSIPDTGEKKYFIENNPAKDSIMVWLLDSTLYSKQQINTIISYPYTDSTERLVTRNDTIPMRYLTGRTSKTKESKNTFKYTTSIKDNFLKPGQQILISSQTPFRQPDTSRIKIYESAKSTKKIIPYSLIKDSSISERYFLNAKFKEGVKYIFIAEPAAFGNIYGEVSDSARIYFSVQPANSFGHLTLNIQNGKGDLIIQLLDKKETLVDERKIKNEGTVEFPLLERGFYRVRVVYDLNSDGKWTTGDFNLKRQPEPVSYFPHEIEIKINWVMIEDWDVGTKNFKDQKLRSPGE
jgi:uncharacterized protein (DUF2141 family)